MTPADPTGQQRRPPADLTTTHTLDIGPTTVVKRYRSWDRDEPRREWQTLTLLARHAPGLAPRPLDRSAHPPAVTMERVPGTPCAAPTSAPHRPPHSPQHSPASTKPSPAPNSTPSRHDSGPRPSSCAAYATSAHNPHPPHRTPTPPNRPPSAQAPPGSPHPTSTPSPPPNPPPPSSASPTATSPTTCGTAPASASSTSRAAGRADRIHELAEITEHISAWSDSELDTDTLLGHFTLTPAETRRLRELRRLTALMWLCMLTLDRATAHPRNPPGTVTRQARRLLHLLN